MKVVILAGGFGTRISEYTKTIPKPMIKIKKKPILHHIMDHYAKFGFHEFYIALGYKGHVIREYFKKKKLKNLIGNETFMLTYGDGLSDINLKNLLKFHKKLKKITTLTVVRPPARFGAVKIKGSKVLYFKEKSRLDEGWINGGFFVMEPEIFNYIKNNKTFLEKEPLENISKKKELVAYKHHGFWQCMDTKRDKDFLEKILK